MKKITLLMIVGLLWSVNSNAQYLTEDFEGGVVPPAGWASFIGTNGLGTVYDWTTSATGNDGSATAAFVRYENVTGGTAEDWLVTSQIDLTTATNAELRFFTRQAFTSSYGSIFEVRVSTVSQTTDTDFTTVVSYDEDQLNGNSVSYVEKIVDLSAYDGMMIYLSFVHLNDDGDSWYVDDVSVQDAPTCSPAEGTATVGTSDCGGADNFFIDVDVTSLGDATTVTISNDGGVASTDVTATGIVSVGPFASGATVNISLDHDADPLCNADLPAVTFVCPISNDECDAAIALTVNSDLACGSVTFGTINGATASSADTAACGGTEDDDVWFSFVAAATTHNISLINVANGTTDLYHSVWSGACGALTNLSCSDPNTSIIAGLTIGDTYLLRVYSWTATAGQTSTFDVCIGTPPPPPANDDCGGAEALSIPVAASCPGNTVTSTASATEGVDELPTCDTFGNFGLWYSFVAPPSGQLEFESGIGSPGIVIYEGACGAVTEIAGTCLNNNSGSITGLTPGNPYFAMISTDAAETVVEFCLYSLDCTAAEATTSAVDACSTGEFTIDVDITNLGSSTTVTVANDAGVASTDVTATGVVNVGPFTSGTDVVITLVNETDIACDVDLPSVSFFCPPANDDCGGAQIVTQETNIVDAGSATPITGTLEGSTDSGLPAEECNGFTGAANDDVWYSFEALTSNVTITTDDDVQFVDLVVVLYSGACGTLVVEGCDDNGNPEEISATGLTVGDTYYFRVFQYGTGSTDGDDIIVKVWSSDTLGTDDFETENAFTYFPNPVKGELTLNAQKNIQNVSVYNMLGQEVLKTAPNTVNSTISMSDLSQGAYFVRVTIGNVTETIRIIKQ